MTETANIPARIKLARRMAGLGSQAKLVERIPGWKPSRVGNYEAGVSVPTGVTETRVVDQHVQSVRSFHDFVDRRPDAAGVQNVEFQRPNPFTL